MRRAKGQALRRSVIRRGRRRVGGVHDRHVEPRAAPAATRARQKCGREHGDPKHSHGAAIVAGAGRTNLPSLRIRRRPPLDPVSLSLPVCTASRDAPHLVPPSARRTHAGRRRWSTTDPRHRSDAPAVATMTAGSATTRLTRACTPSVRLSFGWARVVRSGAPWRSTQQLRRRWASGMR